MHYITHGRHTVVCCHIQTTAATVRGRTYHGLTCETMGFLFVGGLCKGFHFQIHPN